MAIEITARHMDATEKMQDYARGKAEAILAEFPQVENIHVILDVEKHRQMAEVVVQAKNHIRAEAAETSDVMLASIDGAIDKVERQLRRLWDRIQDHRPAMKHEEQEREKEIVQ